MKVKVSLLLRLEHKELSWPRIKNQARFVKADLGSLKLANGESRTPCFITMVPVAIGHNTKVNDHGRKGMNWGDFIARKNLTVNLQFLVSLREMMLDL